MTSYDDVLLCMGTRDSWRKCKSPTLAEQEKGGKKSLLGKISLLVEVQALVILFQTRLSRLLL